MLERCVKYICPGQKETNLFIISNLFFQYNSLQRCGGWRIMESTDRENKTKFYLLHWLVNGLLRFLSNELNNNKLLTSDWSKCRIFSQCGEVAS